MWTYRILIRYKFCFLSRFWRYYQRKHDNSHEHVNDFSPTSKEKYINSLSQRRCHNTNELSLLSQLYLLKCFPLNSLKMITHLYYNNNIFVINLIDELIG
jgi:hypothetical protein